MPLNQVKEICKETFQHFGLAVKELSKNFFNLGSFCLNIRNSISLHCPGIEINLSKYKKGFLSFKNILSRFFDQT